VENAELDILEPRRWKMQDWIYRDLENTGGGNAGYIGNKMVKL